MSGAAATRIRDRSSPGLNLRSPGCNTVTLETLSGLSVFSDNPAFLIKLSDCFELEFFEEGELVMQEGDEGDRMYFLDRGKVEVVVGATSTQSAGDVMGRGSIFGEMALFGQPRRTATVRALELCDCRSIECQVFHQLLEQFPKERRRFFGMSDDRLNRQSPANKPQASEGWHTALNRLKRLKDLRDLKDGKPVGQRSKGAAVKLPKLALRGTDRVRYEDGQYDAEVSDEISHPASDASTRTAMSSSRSSLSGTAVFANVSQSNTPQSRQQALLSKFSRDNAVCRAKIESLTNSLVDASCAARLS